MLSIRSKILSTNPLYVIIIFSVIIYVTTTISLQLFDNISYEQYIPPDSRSYQESAEMLYNQGFKVHPSRPFGYPLIAGLPKLFTSSEQYHNNFLISLQFIFWIATIILIYKIIFFQTSIKFAIIAAIIYSLNLSPIIISIHTLTETSFIFSLVLFIYYLCKHLTSKDVKHLLISLAFLLFSALIKPVNYYPAIAFTMFALYSCFRNSTRIVLNTLIIITLFSLTIGLQLYLNKTQNNVSSFSIIGKQTLYNYLFTKSYSYANNIDVSIAKEMRTQQLNNITSKTSADKQLTFIEEDIKTQMISNTMNVIKSYFSNLAYGFVNGSELIYHLKDFNKNDHFAKIKTLFYRITVFQNVLYTMSLILAAIFLVIKTIQNRTYLNDNILPIILTTFSSYLYILANISTGQGDRLNIVFFPMIIIAVFLIIHKTKSLSLLQHFK